MRSLVAALVFFTTTSAWGASPLVYVKKATREQSRQASLQATQQALPAIPLEPWWRLDGRFEVPPDGVVNVDVPPSGQGKLARKWRKAPEIKDGVEHRLPAPTQLYRTITLDRDVAATLTFGIDNGIVINHDGKAVHVTITTYIPPIRVLSIPLRLHKGTNHLQITAGIREKTTRFWFALSPISKMVTDELEQRLDEDFPRQTEDAYYRLQTIATPEGVPIEVGGMAYIKNRHGETLLLVCTRRGEVWTRTLQGQWHKYAEGLQEPLGLWAKTLDEIFVLQRGELTRLTDENQDGKADHYEVISKHWNLSGGHHEYLFGLVRNAKGQFFIAMCALGNASRATYLGWISRIDPAAPMDQRFEPWAYGVRCPNGLALNANEQLFVTDNQGEYIPSSQLYQVNKGDFFGHPGSMFANPKLPPWSEDPSVEELGKRRKAAAIVFPYGVLGQSPTQPLFDTSEGRFGPFAGQMFVGDQTSSAITRVFLEEVDGVTQGAAFPFRKGFQSGNNRLVMSPDGSLWVGQTDRGWGATGGKEFGIQTLTWSGKVPFEIKAMHLANEGFDLAFTKQIDAKSVKKARFTLRHYHYPFGRTYGVAPTGHTNVTGLRPQLSSDGLQVSLHVPQVIAGRLYELKIEGLSSRDNENLLHDYAVYTVNRTRSNVAADLSETKR